MENKTNLYEFSTDQSDNKNRQSKHQQDITIDRSTTASSSLQILPSQPQSQSINSHRQNHFQMYPIQSYQVGQRLDRYLKNSSMNWTFAQKQLRSKNIYILSQKQPGVKIRSNDYKLQQGDQMYLKKNIASAIHQQKSQNSKLCTIYNQVPLDYSKQILDKITIFDNKNITILNKPHGFSVQGGEQIQKNLFSLMAARYKKQYVHVTHRLDKPTTGVLIFCKNLFTAQLIQAAIEGRKQYSKYYLALTLGRPISQKEGYIRCNIEWTKKQKARLVQSIEKQASKDSMTYFKRLFTENLNMAGDTINLLGAKLITGRKHQLRCHFSDYLLNPILNDRRYGAVMLKEIEDENKTKESAAQGKSSRNSIKKDITNIPPSKSQTDQGSIFLHALMTTITNPQIVQRVFQINKDKILESINTKNRSIFHSNQKGMIMLENGHIKIFAHPPSHWKDITEQSYKSYNHPNLQNIQLNFSEVKNSLSLALDLQKSEKAFGRNKSHIKRSMTIQ